MHKSTILVLSMVLVVAFGVDPGCLAQPQNPTPAISANSQPATTNSPQPQGAQDNAGAVSVNGTVGSGGEVPANTELRATLDTPLSTKTSKPGDRFTATVSQPVSGSVGVVVPVGSRLEGEVSETDQTKSATVLRGKETLNLRFRDIVLPNGQTVPLVSSLVSVNSTNGRTTQRAENRVESGSQGKTVTTDPGLDAGVGGSASPRFGEPLKGLAIGNLSGGGYVLATTARQPVMLPAQTGMVIRLDQPLKVE